MIQYNVLLASVPPESMQDRYIGFGKGMLEKIYTVVILGQQSYFYCDLFHICSVVMGTISGT